MTKEIKVNPKVQFKRVYIEISNICNLNCEFCSEVKRKKQIMSPSDFEYIIEQIKPHANFIYLHVKGEPLLHPNLKEIMQICEKNNMQVNITTNATLLDEHSDFLLHSPALRQMNISVHSLAAQQKIDTNKYLNTIIDFTKKCDLIGKYVVLRFWNLDQNRNIGSQSKEAMSTFSKAFNVNYDLVSALNVKNSVKISDNVFIGWEKEFVWPSCENDFVSNDGYCYGMRHQIAILADGTVVPCCLDSNGECALGNIFVNTFDEIISSDLAKGIRHGFEKRQVFATLCKHCSFRTRFDKK
ncbi:MAG: radical SAM protein [Oscillospiraceae bacterium]